MTSLTIVPPHKSSRRRTLPKVPSNHTIEIVPAGTLKNVVSRLELLRYLADDLFTDKGASWGLIQIIDSTISALKYEIKRIENTKESQ